MGLQYAWCNLGLFCIRDAAILVFFDVRWLLISPYSCIQVKKSGDAWDVGTSLLLVSASTGQLMKPGMFPASGRCNFLALFCWRMVDAVLTGGWSQGSTPLPALCLTCPAACAEAACCWSQPCFSTHSSPLELTFSSGCSLMLPGKVLPC